MTETIQNQLDDLRALRLPDLQARFAELVGEETRCPNKAPSCGASAKRSRPAPPGRRRRRT